METPHVTICVPAYNAARTISRTLDSILAQDYPNYDVLVSDNLSLDDTVRIIKNYEERGVRYFLNPDQETWDASENFNHALSLAEGPLIALYHADDLYTSNMVSRQVEFLRNHPKTSAVFTKTQTIDEFDRPIRNGLRCLPKELKDQEEFDFPDLLNAVLKYGNFLTVPTMMARRESLDKAGSFDLKFCTAADIDLYLRLSRLGTVGIIDEPLHNYRVSENQGSVQLFKLQTYRAHFLQVMDHYLSIPEFRQLVKPQAFRFYEMYSISDDIVRAMNMFFLGNVTDAQRLIKSALSRPAFIEGLLTKQYARQFFLSLPVFVAIQLGKRKLLYSLYERYYKPWRRYRRLQLFKKKERNMNNGCHTL